MMQTRHIVLLTMASFGTGIDLTIAAGILGTITQALCPSRAREQLRKNIMHMQDAFTACEQCSMPVIAAVQGENPHCRNVRCLVCRCGSNLQTQQYMLGRKALTVI